MRSTSPKVPRLKVSKVEGVSSSTSSRTIKVSVRLWVSGTFFRIAGNKASCQDSVARTKCSGVADEALDIFTRQNIVGDSVASQQNN